MWDVWTDLSAMSDRCEKLRSPGPINLIVSIFILVGMLISYLPQHYRIVARGTSEGISPYFVLLGVTSATSGFANILTLPQSRQDVACCKDLDTFHCLAGLLGMAQLGVQWICVAFILVLFLVFFRFDASANLESPDHHDEEDLPAPSGEQPGWQTAVTVACVCFIHGLAVIIITAIVGYVFPQQLSTWANALGLMAAALAGVQYIPQIWTTYHLKHVGSLSIPMMCIQTPGGFLFAGSLFARLGPEGWSSWGIFLLTAAMQGILLCMAIYYEIRRDKAAASGEDATDGDEETETLLDHSPTSPNGRSGGGGLAATPDAAADGVRNGRDRQDSESAAESQPLLKAGNGVTYRT